MVTEAHVLDLTRKWSSTGVDPSLDSDVVTDLKIDGDSFEEFIGKLAGNEQLTGRQDWLRYYHAESELSSPLYILRWIGFKLGLASSPPLRSLDPFTLRDLTEALNGGCAGAA